MGTDANRNWGYHFNDGGSSDSSCSDTYHGPEAFSEVENRNVRDFVDANKNQIKFFNSIHSYSQYVLLPWGFTEDPCPDYDDLFAMAERVILHLKFSKHFLYQHSQQKYHISGC